MLSKLGGRKMVAATLTVGIGLGAVALKGDVPPNLLQLLEIVFSVFAGANAINTALGTRIQMKKESTVVPEVEPVIKEEIMAPAPVEQPQPDPNAVANKDVVTAFNVIMNQQAANQAETKAALDVIVRTLQMTQTALNTVAEKAFSK